MAPAKSQTLISRAPSNQTTSTQTPGVGTPLATSLLAHGCPHIQQLFEDPQVRKSVLRAYELAVRLGIGRRDVDKLESGAKETSSLNGTNEPNELNGTNGANSANGMSEINEANGKSVMNGRNLSNTANGKRGLEEPEPSQPNQPKKVCANHENPYPGKETMNGSENENKLPIKSTTLETQSLTNNNCTTKRDDASLPTKIQNIKCHVCKLSSPSTFCCLQCSFVGCQEHSQSTHYEDTPHHPLLVDLVGSGDQGLLYCAGCRDFVFDMVFEQVRTEKVRQFLELGLPGMSAGSVLDKTPLSLGLSSKLRAGPGDKTKKSRNKNSITMKRDTNSRDSNSSQNTTNSTNDNNNNESKESDGSDETAGDDDYLLKGLTNDYGGIYTDEEWKKAKQYYKDLGPGYDIVQHKALLPSYQATSALRGFCNMGSTCFMSVIFQSLLHNPLIRNFYLSGGHERGLMCGHNNNNNSSSGSGSGNDGYDSTTELSSTRSNSVNNTFGAVNGTRSFVDPNSSPNCLACAIDEVFTEFFTSSSVAGFGPTELLTTVWQIQRSLGGNSQQDAHEFLQVVLNELHTSHYDSEVFSKGASAALREIGYSGASIPDTLRKLEDIQIQECGCISHRTFCGELESRIICQVCGTVASTVVDPIMDLSLEIRDLKKKRGAGNGDVGGNMGRSAMSEGNVKNGGGKGLESTGSSKPNPSNGSSDANSNINTNAQPTKVSLEECLERYTSGEKLDALFHCVKCDEQRQIEKKLSIKRLPSVLAIQLKRFSHSGLSSKIETHVDFPLVLDMNSFTTEGAYGNNSNGNSNSSDTKNEGKKTQSIPYQLFGVVCHQGSLNTGHYTCMMKTASGRWFHFDDAVVTTIGVNQVLEKNAYLLFYIVEQVPSIL